MSDAYIHGAYKEPIVTRHLSKNNNNNNNNNKSNNVIHLCYPWQI